MSDKLNWLEELPDDILNSTLFKFTIDIDDNKVCIDLVANLGIDYNNIPDELENSPGQYMYWSAIYSELKMQSIILERKIKRYRGVVINRIIDEANKEKIKLTQKQTDAIVEADDKLNQLEVKYALIQKKVGKLYHMVEALKMKSDNIRSLAGFARAELMAGG